MDAQYSQQYLFDSFDLRLSIGDPFWVFDIVNGEQFGSQHLLLEFQKFEIEIGISQDRLMF